MEYKKGDLVVAGMPELDEAYLARVELVDPRGTHINPIVRVLRVLRYPMQRAITVDAPSEVPPCTDGQLCRLPVLRAAAKDEAERWPDWEASFRESVQARMAGASGEQLRILRRHLQGEFRGRRAMLTYKEYEIERDRLCATL